MTFRDIIQIFIEILQLLIPVLIALAFLTFLYGVVKFIWAAGNAEELKEGKKFLIWGIVAMFVIMALGGIINFLFGEFGFTNTGGNDYGLFFPIPILNTGSNGLTPDVTSAIIYE